MPCRRITGGAASQPAEALQVFDSAPPAGQRWAGGLLSGGPHAGGSLGAGGRQDRPQSGVWVGAASRVKLRRCHILCTVGPGVKIYCGELEAEENTIAHSYRGANVVANGGKVLRCKVKTISTMGRATQGVRIMNLGDGEDLVAVARLAEGDEAGAN